MKKILFPTKFADCESEVFKFASELAYFLKAELLVMYTFGKPEYALTSKELIEEWTGLVNETLIAFVEGNLLKDYRDDILVGYIAKIGYPVESILQIAKEKDVDIIVMGISGKDKINDNLLGQTCLDVLAKADCPVLAIPETIKFEGIEHSMSNLYANVL